MYTHLSRLESFQRWSLYIRMDTLTHLLEEAQDRRRAAQLRLLFLLLPIVDPIC